MNALVALYLFSFGPLAAWRTAARLNPGSLVPAAQNPGNAKGILEYHNKDSKENHYRIGFPQIWSVKAGKVPGSYSLSFEGDEGSVELMDVPDNSTLELFILSRVEPDLKKTVKGYAHKEYRKTVASGRESYVLRYTGTSGGRTFETLKTFISGQDMAVVVTFTVPIEKAASLAKTLDEVVSSFAWEGT